MEIVRYQLTKSEYEAICFIADRYESGQIIEDCLEYDGSMYPDGTDIPTLVMSEANVWELTECNVSDTGDEWVVPCLDRTCELHKALVSAFKDVV